MEKLSLNVSCQIINAMHGVFENNPDDYRNDFDDGNPGEVEDPMGGWEGITEYDEKNIDEDFNK